MPTKQKKRIAPISIRQAILGSLCALGMAACAGASNPPARSGTSSLQAVPSSTANSAAPSNATTPSAVSSASTEGPATQSFNSNPDVAIAKLWQERERDGRVDFPLGAGDLINLSCPDDDEFNGQYLISGQGTITLPLVGAVQAAGRTQDELRIELQDRLKHYLRNPQINLLVGEYRSREVGVFGAVAKPGVYALAGPHDTIQDMISLAGGFTTDASPRIQFKPGVPPAQGASTTAGDPSLIVPPSPSELGDALVVDIDNSEGHSFLGLPARPDDVINVTANGQVMVDGWVSKPGSYPITRDLRVLGAVAAAGGALYPAKTDSIQIVRKENEGQQLIVVDLEKVRNGETHDLPVQDGDVVEVPISGVKAVPYGIYEAAMTMIRVGSYVTP
jgi:protein involved in polysaccharide export with SLBB domain